MSLISSIYQRGASTRSAAQEAADIDRAFFHGTSTEAKMFRTSALIAALLASTLPVAAQPNCAPRDQVAEILINHGETRQSMALSASQAIVEVWANLNTGTWTIVITRPDGLSCMADFGTAFQPVAVVMGEAT